MTHQRGSVEPGRPRAPVLPLAQRARQVGGVLAVLGVLTFGGVAADRWTGSALEAPVAVTAEVRVQPLSGWRLAQRSDGTVLLTRGSGNLLVVASEDGAAADGAAVAADYVEAVLEPRSSGGVRVSPADPVTLASGLVAEGVAYEGEFGEAERSRLVQGEVRAVVEPEGTVVVFDSWAQPEVYAFTADDVAGMTEAAEVR